MNYSGSEHKMDQRLTCKIFLVLLVGMCFGKGFNFGNARYLLVELKNDDSSTVGIFPRNNGNGALRVGQHKRNTDNIRKMGFRSGYRRIMLPPAVNSSEDMNSKGKMSP